MGHVRLGPLARTRKWAQVVGLLKAGADTPQIAVATLNAAGAGLAGAAKDTGVVEAVWLLTQLPLAARSDDFVEKLRRCGLEVSGEPGLVELVSSVTGAIDARMPNCKGRTDLGEMAQMAAAEALTSVLGQRTCNLFGTTGDEVRVALAGLATEKNFGTFAREFFGRFINKCLEYFLSKAVAQHVGEGQRFRTLAEQGKFMAALDQHCREAAVIIDDYSGGWLSKKTWETEGRVTREDVAAFTGYAMTKLTAELRQGARSHGE